MTGAGPEPLVTAVGLPEPLIAERATDVEPPPEMGLGGEILGDLERAPRPRLRDLLDSRPELDGDLIREVLSLSSSGHVRLTEPVRPVRIVTDSTCDLPREFAREEGIRVVPLGVTFDRQSFRDGVDLSPGQFFARLLSDASHPVTSPPEPLDFLKTYRGIVAAQDVVSIHISGELSETAARARKAAAAGAASLAKARADQPAKVSVVDSRAVSLALGLLVLCAARLAKQGLPAEAIVRAVDRLKSDVHALFVVDTLEYLARGGRIGRAQALLGNLLGIKPILGVADGVIGPVDRVRGGKAAQARLVELMAERSRSGAPLFVGIVHAQAPLWADELRAAIEGRFAVEELLVAEIGPVVGTHVGPGTVGVAFLQPREDLLSLLRGPG